MTIKALPELAAKCERAEAVAWRDMVAAASDDYKKEFELSTDVIDDDTYIVCKSIPFVHFNCILGFGTQQESTDKYIDKILDYVKKNKLKLFFVYVIEGLQQDAEELLIKKGFVHTSSWDRIYRTNEAIAENANIVQPGWNIIEIDYRTAEDWASFVSSTYRMPQTKRWLLDFAVRKGWHHFMLKEGKKILAARSIFIAEDGMAFCGVEAPIPGLMIPDYSYDFALMQHILNEGLKKGTKGFTADIELVSDLMSTDAYKNFKALGFTIPYRRKIYKWELS